MIEQAYKSLVGRDRSVTPEEFWGMTPVEVWWLIEARQPVKMYGKMSEAEVKAIYDEDYGSSEDEDTDG